MNWTGAPEPVEPRETTVGVRARVRGVRHKLARLRHAMFADVRGNILVVPNATYPRHRIRYDSIVIGNAPHWTLVVSPTR